MRPSEQIALVLSDIDIEYGVMSVNKACVAGVDRDCTKTGETGEYSYARERWRC